MDAWLYVHMDVKVHTIADRVKVELVLQGKKQPWLAKQARIGRNALKARLDGEVEFSMRDIAAISDALGMDPSELTGLYFKQQADKALAA